MYSQGSRGRASLALPLALPSHLERLLRIERDVVRVQHDPNKRTWSRVLYVCGAAIEVASLVAAISVHRDFRWGLLVGLACFAGGFWVARAGHETRIDFGRRLVYRGKDAGAARRVVFDELVGVAAFAHTVTVRTSEGTNEVRHFGLCLLVADAASTLRETIAAVCRDRVALIREGRQPAPHDLASRLEHLVDAHALEIVDTTDENLVWQAAEWLAKKLELPLVDVCTSPATLRVPEELDLPLGERLARGLEHLDVTTAYAGSLAPNGTSVEQERGQCTLTWQRNHWSNMLFVAGVVLLFPVLGLLLAEEDMVMFWILGACGLLLLPVLVPAVRWHGTNSIAVDRKSVVVTRGPFGKRLAPLSTDSVEAVRVGGTNLHPLLTLVSDQRVLRLPMEPVVARWAKQQIERHLRTMYAMESKHLAPPGQAR